MSSECRHLLYMVSPAIMFVARCVNDAEHDGVREAVICKGERMSGEKGVSPHMYCGKRPLVHFVES